MNQILIISIVIFLMLYFNKKEYFTVELQQHLSNLKCQNNSIQLGIANMYTDEVCQDNQVINSNINNQRLDCRNFVERQILIGNDNKQLCSSDNKIPIINADHQLNNFIEIQNDGINKDNTNNNNNYPFDINQVNIDFTNLDNKL